MTAIFSQDPYDILKTRAIASVKKNENCFTFIAEFDSQVSVHYASGS
jgi:hypothetical protein